MLCSSACSCAMTLNRQPKRYAHDKPQAHDLQGSSRAPSIINVDPHLQHGLSLLHTLLILPPSRQTHHISLPQHRSCAAQHCAPTCRMRICLSARFPPPSDLPTVYEHIGCVVPARWRLACSWPVWPLTYMHQHSGAPKDTAYVPQMIHTLCGRWQSLHPPAACGSVCPRRARPRQSCQPHLNMSALLCCPSDGGSHDCELSGLSHTRFQVRPITLCLSAQHRIISTIDQSAAKLRVQGLRGTRMAPVQMQVYDAAVSEL
jgi:hypothetical protein